jgi:hypothetical protein
MAARVDDHARGYLPDAVPDFDPDYGSGYFFDDFFYGFVLKGGRRGYGLEAGYEAEEYSR